MWWAGRKGGSEECERHGWRLHSKGLLAGWMQMETAREETSSACEAFLLGDKDDGGEVGKSRVGAGFGEDKIGFGHFIAPFTLTHGNERVS